jgi:hypothetical protein
MYCRFAAPENSEAAYRQYVRLSGCTVFVECEELQAISSIFAASHRSPLQPHSTVRINNYQVTLGKVWARVVQVVGLWC